MKRIFLSVAAAVAVGVVSAANAPKYVFLFIGDGMSTSHRMTAENFAKTEDHGEFAMNHMQYQAMTTTSAANAIVTDSAAAATAIACGVKTYYGGIGVDKDGKPVKSCAYAAQKAGRKVGIMTTVTINHATPSGFYASRKTRGDLYGIAIDLANSGFDYFAGGGFDGRANDTKAKEYAVCSNAYEYAESKGYKLVKTREDLLKLRPGCGKVLATFSESALANIIDHRERKSQPTLAEMVSKAIELLDNDNGFFMMAEGGSVDWSAHANDAATNIREIMEMDKAVQVALAFASQHPNDTLVIVTGDHETGGMTMGFGGTGTGLHTERFKAQTMSTVVFSDRARKMMRNNVELKFDEIKPLIEKAFGLKFAPADKSDPFALTAADIADIQKAFDHDILFTRSNIEENMKYDGEKRYILPNVCRRVLNNKAGIGWTSSKHTEIPVLTTASGVGAEFFKGQIDNTDIGKRLIELYR